MEKSYYDKTEDENIMNFFDELSFDALEETSEEKIKEISSRATFFRNKKDLGVDMTEKICAAVEKIRTAKGNTLYFGDNYGGLELNSVNEQLMFIACVADEDFSLAKEWKYYFDNIFAQSNNIRVSYLLSNDAFKKNHEKSAFDLLPLAKCERHLKKVFDHLQNVENSRKK